MSNNWKLAVKEEFYERWESKNGDEIEKFWKGKRIEQIIFSQKGETILSKFWHLDGNVSLQISNRNKIQGILIGKWDPKK